MHITTDAIVLREQPIDDYDSVLTLLTKECGVITAYARGARKPRSSLRPGAELLSYSCFVLFRGRQGYHVNKADTIRLFMGVRGDVEKLSLASYFFQLSSEAVPKEEEASAFLRLLLNCLHLLDTGQRDCGFVKPVFELRFMAMAGFMPDLVACRECGCFEMQRMLFFPLEGQLLCENCVQTSQTQWFQWVERNADRRGALYITNSVLAAMRHICYAEMEKLFLFKLSKDSLKLLNSITETYTVTCIEKRLPTLDFYKNILIT